VQPQHDCHNGQNHAATPAGAPARSERESAPLRCAISDKAR
jgi:hypothetical protein